MAETLVPPIRGNDTLWAISSTLWFQKSVQFIIRLIPFTRAQVQSWSQRGPVQGVEHTPWHYRNKSGGLGENKQRCQFFIIYFLTLNVESTSQYLPPLYECVISSLYCFQSFPPFPSRLWCSTECLWGPGPRDEHETRENWGWYGGSANGLSRQAKTNQCELKPYYDGF